MDAKSHDICLIHPPSPFLLDERVFLPLGLLKLAAFLEKQDFTVHLIDLAGINNHLQALEDLIRLNPQCTTFGISITSPHLPYIRDISALIRSLCPEAKIILGGPHVTLLHAGHKKRRNSRTESGLQILLELADVVVAGDGEFGILQALTAARGTVIDADDPKSPLFLKPEQMDALPMPAWHLMDMDSYRYFIQGHRATSIISQLGCPFRCRFCGGRNSPSLRRIRLRNTDNVIAEMRYLYENFGFTGFMFYDDELNVNRRAYELLRKIIALQQTLGVTFALRGFVKAELIDEELASLMKEAGFEWILSGFESGSPRILKNINKIATVEDNSRCIAIAHKYGLKVKALMSIGHPGESPETVRDTLQWLIDEKPDDFDATIITVYPGTSYHDDAFNHPTEEGIWIFEHPESRDRLYIIDQDFSKTSEYYKGDPEDGYKAYVYTDYLSSTDLVRAREHIEFTVREQLDIPFNLQRNAMLYEHSMGLTGNMSRYVYNKSR